MAFLDRPARFLIARLRDRFRNTWVHRLPMTGQLYELVYRAVDVPSEIEFRGVRLAIDASDTTITPTLLTGQYESTELDLLHAMLEPGMTLIDVGANCGAYTCLASRAVGDTGRVVSFEPVPANLELLTRSVKLNGPVTHNVSVVDAAAGPDQSTLRIHLDEGNSGTHSVGGSGDHFVDVRQTTIDAVVEELGLERIDLIKVDVEGYEPGVLQGASRSLERFTPVLLCEVDADMIASAGGRADSFAAVLGAHGTMYEIDERSGDLVEIGPEAAARLRNANLVVVPPGRSLPNAALLSTASGGVGQGSRRGLLS